MGVFSRLGDIVNSNLNAMLDKAEDPEKIVRLIIHEMEDTLVEVRASAAKMIAERKQIERRLDDCDADAAEWARKAELALEKGREDLAKAALIAKRRAQETAEGLRKELTTIEQGLAKADVDMGKLQSKLDEAKAKKKALELRHRNAQDRVRVKRKLHDGKIDDALARYEGLEAKIDAIEGEAESYDLGGEKAGSVEAEFAKLEAEEAVESELEALKRKVSGSAAKPKTEAKPAS